MPAPLAPNTPPTPWYRLPSAPASGARVGSVESFMDNQATMVNVPSANPAEPDFKLLVLRSGDQWHGFANRCAHFGVPLAAQASQLISTPLKHLTCNVHYARYDWRSGACLSGECDGESLTPVPLECTADGELRIGSAPDAV